MQIDIQNYIKLCRIKKHIGLDEGYPVPFMGAKSFKNRTVPESYKQCPGLWIYG